MHTDDEPLDADKVSDNVVDFVPPEASNGPIDPPPTDDVNKAQPTLGERLVGLGVNPSGDFTVSITKLRGARTIDLLMNHPLNLVEQSGVTSYDMHHRMIVEEATRRQMDATMWAVKALTWKG